MHMRTVSMLRLSTSASTALRLDSSPSLASTGLWLCDSPLMSLQVAHAAHRFSQRVARRQAVCM